MASDYLSLFSMPKPVKITGRTSSITNAFVNGIIPVIPPSEAEVREALAILGMDRETCQCAYCGDPFTEWDHLRPLVKNKRPTGFISEIHNLVPACGKCNQSKRAESWVSWISGPAKLSPKSRGVLDLDVRIERLQRYESWKAPTQLDFESIVGTDIWKRHWDNCEKLHSEMREAQLLADAIKEKIALGYKNKTR